MAASTPTVFVLEVTLKELSWKEMVIGGDWGVLMGSEEGSCFIRG